MQTGEAGAAPDVEVLPAAGTPGTGAPALNGRWLTSSREGFMICQRCGVLLAPDSKFCAQCGEATPPGAASASSPATPPAVSPPPMVAGMPSYPPPPTAGFSVPTGGIPPATGPEGTGIPSPPGMVGDCVRTGWAVFQREGLMLVGMYVACAILAAGPRYTFNHVLGEDHRVNLTIQSGAAVFMLLWPGFIVAGLKAVRGAKVEFTDLFAGFRRLGAVLAWSILGGIATAIGMLFLVLPGIIVALGLSQAGYLVFDRGMGGLDGLKASWRLMTGYRLSLFLLVLALIGINLLGFLAFCIGFLVTAPLTAVVLAVFYERVRRWNGGVLEGEGRLASGAGSPGATAV